MRFIKKADYFENPDQYFQEHQEYYDYFESVKHHFSEAFLKIYTENKRFHDFKIERIKMDHVQNNFMTIEFLLNSNYYGDFENEYVSLQYQNVRGYSVHIPPDKKWTFDILQWYSDEFVLTEDGLWIHKIECDGDCEIMITFEKIESSEL